MSRPAVLGVDPGAQGAVALLAQDQEVPELLAVTVLPTIARQIGKRTSRELDGLALAAQVVEWEVIFDVDITKAMVEQVASMPRDKPPQAFAFGQSYGAVKAALQARGVLIETILPAKWREIAGVGRVEAGDRKALKHAARKRAAALWPHREDLFRRAKDADAAEACLIGLSGFVGQENGSE